MTREELKEHCKKEIEMCEFWAHGKGEELNNNKIYQEHKLILELLEQEPCDDTISRQAVLDLATTIKTDDYSGNEILEVVEVEDIISLPPVTPQQKIGQWINDKCSICGKGIEDLISSCEWYKNETPNCCPFCGAKIESEDA